jgi:hypothetical protein
LEVLDGTATMIGGAGDQGAVAVYVNDVMVSGSLWLEVIGTAYEFGPIGALVREGDILSVRFNTTEGDALAPVMVTLTCRAEHVYGPM